MFKSVPMVIIADSPGVPASANAKELFRGFSYVAPMLLDGDIDNKTTSHTNSVCTSFTFNDESINSS